MSCIYNILKNTEEQPVKFPPKNFFIIIAEN